MNQLLEDSILFGTNAPFIEELYENYLQSPASVLLEWRNYFNEFSQGQGEAVQDRLNPAAKSSALLNKKHLLGHETVNSIVNLAEDNKQISVLQLINAYRFLGFHQANLDPLKRQEKSYIPELDPLHYGLNKADMEIVFNTGSLVGQSHSSLQEILERLNRTYRGSIGAEYMYISQTEQKRWIQNYLEGRQSQPNFSVEYKHHILERLSAAEGLEKYLHTRYVGQKRFSGEGGESLIPLLDSLLERAGKMGVQETVIGMAHRGRLNVLVNTLGKIPAGLFQEFEGTQTQELIAGDVKYHQGFSSAMSTSGGIMHLTLAFNPSHLEIVNPVVEGSVRARQHRLLDTQGNLVLPVLIHGDAAYSGQGVVMETLNLSKTHGYGTGGTVHIIINNQIGFTTSDPCDLRSTLYCTDVSKMIEAPIFHVNADDPEAVVMVTEMALDFRMLFHKDVVIDMICFRRLGHNEQDEPMVTQPMMYRMIRQHPGTRKLYADKLEIDGVIVAGEAEIMMKNYSDHMDAGRNPNKSILYNQKSPRAADWGSFLKSGKWNQKIETGLSMSDLKYLAKKITDIHIEFKLHARVEKIISDRCLMSDGKIPLDWGMAENLAYAALLKDGFPVRISGQDSERGTFFHRHAVLHDQNRERWDNGTYIPLRHIAPNQPDFVVINSVLSEEAVLSFEYGYATTEPNELVVWEAQFGDFANGAQVVIDQFIASGEVKWGRLCNLVMMLPHGQEGQGPEHSSARLERYLQLCAEYNIQICVPSTPAQMFHMLRRQMIRPQRKPLVIMTPKSMLRRKESVSSLEDLAHGSFQAVIPEIERIEQKKVKRIIVCCGKVYFDLLAYRQEHKILDVALIRIEQLYPFPHENFLAVINCYAHVKEIFWCQEEPKNQGAWYFIQRYLLRHISPNQILSCASRVSSASPAPGYLARHVAQQSELVAMAFHEKVS